MKASRRAIAGSPSPARWSGAAMERHCLGPKLAGAQATTTPPQTGGSAPPSGSFHSKENPTHEAVETTPVRGRREQRHLPRPRWRPSGDSQPADLQALVTTRFAGWTPSFQRAARQLVAIDGPPVWADASVAAVAQVADALLENALRHGSGTVCMGSRGYGDHAELRLADEGGGIAPGQEKVIFARHGPLQGVTGVGLAPARGFVDAQGGRIDLVQARPATFRILLPTAANGAAHG